jgi:hypothetical protein
LIAASRAIANEQETHDMSQDENWAGFSPGEARALSGVLDQIVPPSRDGRLPGAGELGLAGHIEQAVQATPELTPAVMQGLAALDDLARRRGAQDYAALPGPDQLELLHELEAAQPTFLPGLIFHTYVGYYQHARVVEALGLEARPPHPDGYELERGDFGMLDRVRARPKLYREV